MTDSVVKVFLVDDHEIVRRGVASLIDSEKDLHVVGEAATVASARARVAATRPDIVLMDVRLPDGSGIDACRDILSSNPDVRCIVLTAYDDDDALTAAVLAGASGYVLKDIRSSGLVDAVRRVASGKSLLDPSILKRATAGLRDERRDDPRLSSLSVREREILTLIADGMTNRQIGETLSLAEKTVKNYVSSLLSKLGLERRTQAVALHIESKS